MIEALRGWTSRQKHVVAASYLGWTLDAFDFFGVTDREPGALLERMPKKGDPSTPGELAHRYQGSEASTRFVAGRAEQLAAAPPSPGRPALPWGPARCWAR